MPGGAGVSESGQILLQLLAGAKGAKATRKALAKTFPGVFEQIYGADKAVSLDLDDDYTDAFGNPLFGRRSPIKTRFREQIEENVAFGKMAAPRIATRSQDHLGSTRCPKELQLRSRRRKSRP